MSSKSFNNSVPFLSVRPFLECRLICLMADYVHEQKQMNETQNKFCSNNNIYIYMYINIYITAIVAPLKQKSTAVCITDNSVTKICKFNDY